MAVPAPSAERIPSKKFIPIKLGSGHLHITIAMKTAVRDTSIPLVDATISDTSSAKAFIGPAGSGRLVPDSSIEGG